MRGFLGRRLGARGQTLVEFTLILPVALLMTVGIIDVARLFAADISLTNGVREAALYAGSGAYVKWCSGDAADVPCPTGWTSGNISANAAGSIGYVIQGESTGITVTNITLQPPVCDGAAGTCDSSSNTVRITASYPFVPLTPMITAILGSPITLTAATTAQIQK
jgi:TadE-like protein